MTLRWTGRSLRDLEAIRQHIAADNEPAAVAIVRRIHTTAQRLHDPVAYTGRTGRVADTRELIVTGTPYVVVYRQRGEALEILRVLHGAQKWPPSSS